MAKKTYWTKCEIEFQKPSTAEVTGYELKLLPSATDPLKVKDDIERVECRTCPFVNLVEEGYKNPVFKRFECRAGSKKPNHKTEWTGRLDDKNTIGINSLDHDLMEEILKFCSDHPDLNASYNADHLADCRRTLSISCSSNKKGMAAKKELIDKFFSEKKSDPIDQINKMWKDFMKCGACNHAIDYGESAEYRKCELKKRRVSINQVACDNFGSAKQEIEEVKQDCITPTRACGKCNAGHWYSEENTYVSVVADDGIKTTKRPCEPHTHYCYQFTEGQKKIASDKDFNPDTAPEWCPLEKDIKYTYETDKYESKDNAIVAQGAKVYELTCDSCAYRPGNAKKVCNRVGNNRIAAPGQEACEWYNNLKTGEMAPQQFEWNYEGGYPDCMYKDFPDSSVKRVYYTIPEKKLPEDAQTVNDTQTDELANHDINRNERRCINCSYYSGDNEANYHCSKLSAYKDSYGVPLPHANGCSDFDSKWDEKVNGTPEIDTKSAATDTFDYSTVDADTADFLQEKASKITEIRLKSVLAIGKELKEAQDKLANNKNGTFGAWVSSIGITRQTAYNYINGYEFIVKNFDNIEAAEDLSPSLLFAVAKKDAPKELTEQVVSGDITSLKEYKTLEEKLKAAEERAMIYAGKADESEKRERAREQERDFEADKALKNYMRIGELEQQLDQVKRNSDPAKVQELGNIISEKQQEIETLKKQLKDKPIEVPAVKEVIPDVARLAIYEKVSRLYEGLCKLTETEIQIFAEDVCEDYRDDVIKGTEDAMEVLAKIASAVWELTE